MKRREFSLALGAALLATGQAQAQAQPVEGKDFVLVQPPVPVAVPGKIEVIEFFGYWCPHCFELEPTLEAWVRKLPATVNFRRIPVAWQAAHVPYQKLYFALEALGLLETMNAKVFNAVHVQHQRFDNDAGISAFATANGIDRAKLLDAMNSFSVSSKIRIANQVYAAYRLDGVPVLAVNGRYRTSPELAKGDERALQVVDALILRAKAGR
jgi:thiol:disulfide interchange protein DsbA